MFDMPQTQTTTDTQRTPSAPHRRLRVCLSVPKASCVSSMDCQVAKEVLPMLNGFLKLDSCTWSKKMIRIE